MKQTLPETNPIPDKQRQAALIAVFTALSLTLAKLIIAYFSASMAVLASALDSGMDVAASAMNYLSIRHALKPADEDHHYGHGKAESLAGFVQGQLMLLSGAYIVASAIWKSHTNEIQIYHTNIAILVMALSGLSSWLLYRFLKKAAQKTGSIALKADSLHYFTDVLTNFVVAISITVIHFTQFYYIDVVLSIAIAIYICWAAWEIIKEAIDVLMDKSLPPGELSQIHERISTFFPDITSYHNLQTRKSGNRIFMEMHIVLPSIQNLVAAHELSTRLIASLTEIFPDACINIHIDPKDDREEGKKSRGGLYRHLGQ